MIDPKNISKEISAEFDNSQFDEWKAMAEKSINTNSLDKLTSGTYENIDVKPLYSKQDIDNLGFQISEFTGVPPYLRGTQINGYKIKKWDMSQELIAFDANEFNKKVKENLSRGQTAIALNSQLITHNSKLKTKNYVPRNADDFKIAFDGIDLKKVPLNIFAGDDSFEYLNVIEGFLSESKQNWNDIKGGIDCDPIGKLVETGTMTDLFENVFDEIKKYIEKAGNSEFKFISVSGIPYREGGGNVLHELAFTLATSVFYVRELLKRNIEIDNISQKMRFVLTTGNDFFLEIAKIRAVRILWAKVIKEFGGNEESQKLNLYIKSLEMNKSELDPWVNLLRNTTEAMSSIFGGCDTIEIGNFFDGSRQSSVGSRQSAVDSRQSTVESLKVNSKFSENLEFSERVTRNTQIVLAEECDLTEVCDPAGGSYYIEYLTNEIAEKSWELFREVEIRDGIFEALKQGFPQEQVAKARNERIRNISERKEVILGANKYPNLSEREPETVNREPKLKTLNSQLKTQNSQLITSIPKVRSAELFENLRQKAIEFSHRKGELPKVFIAAFGPLSKHKARVDFSTDFFNVGGFETTYNVGYENFEEAAKEFFKSGMNILVICSSDDLYSGFVPQLARLVKRAKPLSKIILAGNPVDKIDEYKNSGVDEFIHRNSDMVKVLNEMYDSI